MVYSSPPLQNARELLAEASLQYTDGHMARAYRLAAASIEETEKGLQAFDTQESHLLNVAATTNGLLGMKGHARKIFACTDWIWNYRNISRAIKMALDLMIHAKRHSGQAMSGRTRALGHIVREQAARNCVGLAKNRLADALSRIAGPPLVTRFHDRLFAMDAGQFQRILTTDDFWWYYIARLQSGSQDWAEAVLDYDRDHFAGGTLFKPAPA